MYFWYLILPQLLPYGSNHPKQMCSEITSGATNLPFIATIKMYCDYTACSTRPVLLATLCALHCAHP